MGKSGFKGTRYSLWSEVLTRHQKSSHCKSVVPLLPPAESPFSPQALALEPGRGRAGGTSAASPLPAWLGRTLLLYRLLPGAWSDIPPGTSHGSRKLPENSLPRAAAGRSRRDTVPLPPPSSLYVSSGNLSFPVINMSLGLRRSYK
ncbi:unnamed protein product [Natator depressus]